MELEVGGKDASASDMVPFTQIEVRAAVAIREFRGGGAGRTGAGGGRLCVARLEAVLCKVSHLWGRAANDVEESPEL